MKKGGFLFGLAVLGWLVGGCASRDVNPPQARAHTGYVDFRTEPSGELAWEVLRYDADKRDFRAVFTDFEPRPDRLLRLAFPPGHYRFQVTFLNRVLRGPGEVEVEVRDGMITPVRVALVPDGTVLVDSKEQRVGPSAKGRFGRTTRITSEETFLHRIEAKAGAPMAYQAKEELSYGP